MYWIGWIFFFQAEDGIRDRVRSRGLGDVYKRQVTSASDCRAAMASGWAWPRPFNTARAAPAAMTRICLLYTSDAADERSSVDLGGRRILKKKKQLMKRGYALIVAKDCHTTITGVIRRKQ